MSYYPLENTTEPLYVTLDDVTSQQLISHYTHGPYERKREDTSPSSAIAKFHCTSHVLPRASETAIILADHMTTQHQLIQEAAAAEEAEVAKEVKIPGRSVPVSCTN